MRQKQFENENKTIWETYSRMIEALGKSKSKRPLNVRIEDLPETYRKVCYHYAIALNRQYSPALVTYLHNLVLSGHKYIYRSKPVWLSKILIFIGYIFPASIRRNAVYVAIATALFLLPAIFSGLSCYHDEEIIYSMMNEHQVRQMEYMYDPNNDKIGRTEGRGSDTDLQMFGFYIRNNIGIAFRTFAGGMLAGIGSVFFLVYNGLILGSVAGHLTKLNFIETFWPFVSGHGSFELTAIVISGAAGLMLAKGIVAPGRYKRLPALKMMAKEALVMMTGAALMLLAAAFVEAFWSSGTQPIWMKYAFAAILWISMFSYFLFAGKFKRS